MSVGLMITNDVNIGWEMFFWPKSDILYKTVQIDDEMELIYTGIVSREVLLRRVIEGENYIEYPR